MFYRVDFTQPTWRWLFQPIYARIEKAAQEFGSNLEIVTLRMTQLLVNDPSVILLVRCNDNDVSVIESHCLLNVIKNRDNTYQVYCEQLYSESKADEEFTRYCIQYVEEEVTKTFPTTEITMSTDESKYRAFRKKYEFEVKKVFMGRAVKKDIDQL